MNPSDLHTQFVEIPTPADGSTKPVPRPAETPALPAAQGGGRHGELSEVLPGYVLEQRLGAGGYGEVWRASAPGGLTKAVKILHGNFDGPQAEAELKSLQRVRELRHPFLLNLERIEVAAGRLIIVTELAEGSLEDRFAACKRQGLAGIPRDELLGYLRDAADALDFMLTRHGLQHLDVKPDNILLQGAHAKLADFGLTKELNRTNVSLVGAFTPLYAPPELYEGNPSASSDQYSLAIVYQAMLTGSAPFAGRSAAQLASQHLSSLPDLAPLPSCDRPAVARALSKNPKARFGSCREFVEDLATRARSADRKPSPGAAARKKTTDGATGEARSDTTELVKRIDAQPLAPPTELQQAAHGPCVIVGLGGLAGRILANVRRRAVSRFGEDAPLPAVPLLAIDTDRQSLGAAVRGTHGFALRDTEVLPIPLRSPQEYRDGDGNVGEWLSRRWLYNIPRSREVERFRPLGRLALVDHARSVRARLAAALQEATAPEASTATAQATGLQFDPKSRRVLIVASIDGGTGSGAVLDLAYLAHDVLEEFGGGRVEGLLIHGTGLRDDDRDLATANALACLAELERFAGPAGYPGDRGCGLAPSGRPPFDGVHVVHAGDDLDDAGFDRATQDVAEAVFRDRLTPAGRFFETIRQTPPAAEPDSPGTEQPEPERSPTVRTIGVATLHGGAVPVDERAIDQLACGLLRSWQGVSRIEKGPRQTGDPEAAEWAAATLGELELRADQLLGRAMGVLRGEWGRQVDAFFRLRAQEINNGGGAPGSLWAAVDVEFAESDDDGSAGWTPRQPWAVVDHLRNDLDAVARDAAARFRGRLFTLVDRSPRHLDAATEAFAEFLARLGESRDAVAGVLEKLMEEMNELRVSASRSASSRSAASPSGGLDSPVYQYALLRFCEHTYRCILRHASAVAALLKTLPDELRQLRQDLRTLESHWPTSGTDSTESSSEADPLRHLPAVDERVRTAGRFRLAAALAEDADPVDVAARLRDEVRLFLMLQESGTDQDRTGSPASVEGQLGEAARPRLSRLGGSRRVLAVVPDESQAPQWRSKLVEIYGDCVTVLSDPAAGLFIGCEDQDIPLAAVRPALCEHRMDLAEMAARLHTRIDIEW